MGYQRVDWNEVVVVNIARLEDEEEDGFSGCLLGEGVVFVGLAELRLDEIDCGGKILHPEGLFISVGRVTDMRRDYRYRNGWASLTCCVRERA